MWDNLQAATGFQILLLFTVVLMRLNPSRGEVRTACQAGALAATPPGLWKEALVYGPTTGARR